MLKVYRNGQKVKKQESFKQLTLTHDNLDIRIVAAQTQ